MFCHYQIRAAGQPAENLTARGTARLNEVASSWLEKALVHGTGIVAARPREGYSDEDDAPATIARLAEPGAEMFMRRH